MTERPLVDPDKLLDALERMDQVAKKSAKLQKKQRRKLEETKRQIEESKTKLEDALLEIADQGILDTEELAQSVPAEKIRHHYRIKGEALADAFKGGSAKPVIAAPAARFRPKTSQPKPGGRR